MDSGRIKIHRKITDRERYDDVNVRLVFLHLLFSVNHKEKKRQGQTVGPGEIITSYGSLASSVGLSVKQVRLAISKLQSTGELEQQTASKRQRLILINWGKYQSTENEEGKQTTIKGQSKGNQRATTKEVKNIRNKEIDISNTISTTVDEKKKELGKLKRSLLEEIKNKVESHGFVYQSGDQERNRCHNILTAKKFGEVADTYDLTRQQLALLTIEASVQDDFRKGKIYNAETIYKHYIKLINKTKSQQATSSTIRCI